MSFWAKLGVKITDITCFRASCDKHNITYEETQDSNFKMQGFPVHAILEDMKQGGSNFGRKAFLVRDGGAFKVIIDNDAGHSTLTKRLGRNGGKLTRDYASNVVKKGVTRNGGMILSEQEQPDGSMILKVSQM